MSNAIELRGVEKSFRDFKLGPLSWSVPAGYIVGFIGENGAGKSTTMKLVLGLMPPDKGEIRLLGNDINCFTPEMKKEVAYVFDDLYLPGEFTLKNVRIFHEKLYGRAWEDQTFSRLVQRFQLPEGKPIQYFSRGMRMQLGLALALSHQARLLLLDEATSGLDPLIRDDVLDLLMAYIQDERNTVLVSSHILSDLEKAADYIAFIHQGRLLFMEEKDELVEKYGLLSLSEQAAEALNPEAIVGRRPYQFGVELLVKRELLPKGWEAEKVSIEDIMLFMIRGDRE